MDIILFTLANTYIYPEILFITLLLCYIIYLHFKLNKKNNLLKFYFKDIIKSKNRIEKEDLLKFLDNLKNPEFSNILLKDKILDENIIEFLFENDSETKLFLHYTSTENIAQKIISEGFRFVNSFYKTAEQIFNDKLHLIQRHNEHKQFGHFVIAISISKDIFNYYSNELSKTSVKNVAVEQFLTELKPYPDENSELVYTLPKQFIKGYFNYANGSIVANPDYNPNYKSKIFDKNIQNIKLN